MTRCAILFGSVLFDSERGGLPLDATKVPAVRTAAVVALRQLGALVTPHAGRVARRLTAVSRLVRYSSAEARRGLEGIGYSLVLRRAPLRCYAT